MGELQEFIEDLRSLNLVELEEAEEIFNDTARMAQTAFDRDQARESRSLVRKEIARRTGA